MKGTRSHDDSIVKMLKSDLGFEEEYLRSAIEELGEPGGDVAFRTVLRHIALARGGINKIAESSGMKREAVSRALSPRGNPTFKTLMAIFRALNIKLIARDKQGTEFVQPQWNIFYMFRHAETRQDLSGLLANVTLKTDSVSPSERNEPFLH